MIPFSHGANRYTEKASNNFENLQQIDTLSRLGFFVENVPVMIRHPDIAGRRGRFLRLKFHISDEEIAGNGEVIRVRKRRRERERWR